LLSGRNWAASGQVAKELFDLAEQRKADIERMMRGVKGFRAYSLFRTADGGVSVTVCEDKAGAGESIQVSRDWIKQNAANLSTQPPVVAEGTVILQLS
jgi:hypothetical protein